MAYFYSRFINRLDAKGRVSVPSVWRRDLEREGHRGLLFRPHTEKPMLEGMDQLRVGRIAESLDDEFQYPEENILKAEAAQIALSQFQRLDFDTNGRVLLPQELIAHASLSDAALFLGVGLTLQIWNPDNYTSWEKQTMAEARKQNVTARLKPPMNPSQSTVASPQGSPQTPSGGQNG